MTWKGEKERHKLASQGVKTSIPLTVYHGSPKKNIKILVPRIIPKKRQYDNATSRFGVFFSVDKEESTRYMGTNIENGVLYEATLQLKKPYEMSLKQFNYFQSPNRDKNGNSTNPDYWDTRNSELIKEAELLQNKLVRQGYDGVIVRHSDGTIYEISSFSNVPVKRQVKVREYLHSPGFAFDES